jgi:hypothetical protein
MLFHSFFSWKDYDTWGTNGDLNGSLFSLDVEWAIMPSLALYGQLVMNEFSTPYELERWPESQAPNGLGYLAGLEYTHTFDHWGTLFYGEFVYTDPYLYVLSSPFGSFYWMRRLSDLTSKARRYTWIGHPEGRDSLLFSLGASANKENISLSSELSFIRKGEHTLVWDWSKGAGFNDQSTPSGTAENKFIATVGAGWKPLPVLSLSAQVSGIFVFNADHIEGQQKIGMETILSAVFTY